MSNISKFKVIAEKKILSRQDTLNLLEYSIESLISWGVSISDVNKVRIIRDTFYGRYINRQKCYTYLTIIITGANLAQASIGVINRLKIIRDLSLTNDFRGRLLIDFIDIISNISGVIPSSNWILATGVWNDIAIWNDTAIWKD